jgi:mRNA interferase MazF
MEMVASRFEIVLLNLDPTIGSEIRKTRPCVVISPDEMNRHLRTLIVAPMTTKTKGYPTRIPCTLQGKEGQIVLDQIRTVDRARIVKSLGRLDAKTSKATLAALSALFAP